MNDEFNNVYFDIGNVLKKSTTTISHLSSPSFVNWTSTTGYTPSSGFGTTANSVFIYRRVGDTISVHGSFTIGTVAASLAYIALPAGITIDTTKVTFLLTPKFGECFFLPNALTAIYPGEATIAFYDNTDNTKIYLTSQTQGFSFLKMNGNAAWASNANLDCNFEFPVTGWAF